MKFVDIIKMEESLINKVQSKDYEDVLNRLGLGKHHFYAFMSLALAAFSYGLSITT
jgi:hypothetical protein